MPGFITHYRSGAGLIWDCFGGHSLTTAAAQVRAAAVMLEMGMDASGDRRGDQRRSRPDPWAIAQTMGIRSAANSPWLLSCAAINSFMGTGGAGAIVLQALWQVRKTVSFPFAVMTFGR
jgi:hypothetical protein